MTVSVIVPTYNGAHKILNILGALAQQTYQPTEVLVVVDGSTDNTVALLEQQKLGLPGFRVITQENRGRAAVRNTGAAHATGELLVFFDDDMRPAPTCLAEHVQHHQQHPNTIAVGMQLEDFEAVKTDFQRYKAFLSRKWFSVFDKPTTPIDKQRPFITAANFSLPAKLFVQLGRFDEQLRDAEDFDLAMRAVNQGVELFALSNAIGWHDDFVTCASYVKRLRQYKTAHQVLREVRPELYEKYPQYDPVIRARAAKELVYALFANDLWVRAIDHSRLQWLPKRVRYKLYDVVTTALGYYFPSIPVTTA